MDNELFEQLQRLQIENAALRERISELQLQANEQDDSPEDSESEAYAAEIAALKIQIASEHQETVKLKRQLAELIKCQELLQAESEGGGTFLATTLTPLLQTEEQETQAYYDLFLAKCATVPNADLNLVGEVIAGVQLKQRMVADATAENQKIHRLIALNRAQLTDVGPVVAPVPRCTTMVPASGRKGKVAAVPAPDVFNNPLSCLVDTRPHSESIAPRRRRVNFRGKEPM
jgi:regulator of replication initiation timing